MQLITETDNANHLNGAHNVNGEYTANDLNDANVNAAASEGSAENANDAEKTAQFHCETSRTDWKRRRSGILLPIFSLPDRYGIGTLGKTAHDFIDYLALSGVSVWQILPLLPTGYGDSPYQSVCSYAHNYYMIDLDDLVKRGLLDRAEADEYARQIALRGEEKLSAYCDSACECSVEEKDDAADESGIKNGAKNDVKNNVENVTKNGIESGVKNGVAHVAERIAKDVNGGEKASAVDSFRIDYEYLFLTRVPLLKKAFARFNGAEYAKSHAKDVADFAAFVDGGEYYDFALFMTLKERFCHAPWTEWGEFAEYDERKTNDFAEANAEEMKFWQFTQYLFLLQWKKLRAHAAEKGIEIFGDMPIYVSSDSVEAWKYGKTLFETDERGWQTKKAGVPPDAFSADGQLWGNPVYRFDEMKADGYAWWRSRIKRTFELLDIVRIDHFRAFDRFYVVDAEAETAREGRWADGPKEALFEGLESLHIVAEDLGIIDDGVRRLMKNVGYPGMRVLEFAFDGKPENTHKPSNSPKNSVAYTGTHDNAPFAAYVAELADWERERFSADFKRECEKSGFISTAETPEEFCADAVRMAFASDSFLCVVPMQDVLMLGGESRINRPSVLTTDNWSFRFSYKQLFSGAASERLLRLGKEYGRL